VLWSASESTRLDEESVEFSLQAGWKQKCHAELIDPISRNRIEAVFRSLKSYDALDSCASSLQQIPGMRRCAHMSIECFESGWRHNRGIVIFTT